MSINISHFKALLEATKKQLEQGLQKVGHKKTTNSEDWEAVQNEVNESTADRAEVADSITDYESNTAIVSEFETDLIAVDRSLERIEAGTYGTCEVCNKEIEEARLNANPAARTCIAHKEEVL